jgi:hypothetical protein
LRIEFTEVQLISLREEARGMGWVRVSQFDLFLKSDSKPADAHWVWPRTLLDTTSIHQNLSVDRGQV